MKNSTKHRLKILVLSAVVCVSAELTTAQQSAPETEIVKPAAYRPITITESPDLQRILDESIKEVLIALPASKIKPDDIAVTLTDLRDPNRLISANYRGGLQIYPASVVKMFYMAALHQQLEDRKVTLTKELERGLRDMIVDSSNEATQYILDVLTDTASGAEKPPKDFEAWQYKRNRVNRYFSSMGYENINVNQKTFCEDAYGIEQQSRAYKGQNRNMLTTNATARLLAEISLGRMVTPPRSKMMMDLMERDPFAETKDQEDQAHGFTGIALIENKMTDAKLWSKAGWTSSTRHDAAYIETADGLKFVIVIFTEHHASDRAVIPAIVSRVIRKMREKAPQTG